VQLWKLLQRRGLSAPAQRNHADLVLKERRSCTPPGARAAYCKLIFHVCLCFCAVAALLLQQLLRRCTAALLMIYWFAALLLRVLCFRGAGLLLLLVLLLVLVLVLALVLVLVLCLCCSSLICSCASPPQRQSG
jgi:hypothetical protein